jgi:glycosyl transferase, family 25
MPPTTIVRVISLASASVRRENFASDARQTIMDWKYFDALRGPEESEAQLRHDPAATITHTGRPLHPGELGCYASHYNLWCCFLGTDKDQLVVFEDDVSVDWVALELLCKHNLAEHGMHILRLFSTHPLKATIARYKLYSDHSHLLQLSGYCYGTQAYILTRTGAAALVKSCQRLTMPVDWAMSRYWDYKITNYAVFPYPILERLGPSMIDHGRSLVYLSTRRQRFERLKWRIRERLRRLYFDARSSSNALGTISDNTSILLR